MHSGTLYLGTGASGGLFKSVDGAATWTLLPGPLRNEIVSGLVLDSTNPSTIYAVAEDVALYRSTDGGTTWSTVRQSVLTSARIWRVAIAPTASSTLLVDRKSVV